MKCVREETGIERKDLRVFAVKVSFAFIREEKTCATVKGRDRKELSLS